MQTIATVSKKEKERLRHSKTQTNNNLDSVLTTLTKAGHSRPLPSAIPSVDNPPSPTFSFAIKRNALSLSSPREVLGWFFTTNPKESLISQATWETESVRKNLEPKPMMWHADILLWSTTPYSTFPSVSFRTSIRSSLEVVLVLKLSISGCLTLSHGSRADQFNLQSVNSGTSSVSSRWWLKSLLAAPGRPFLPEKVQSFNSLLFSLSLDTWKHQHGHALVGDVMLA